MLGWVIAIRRAPSNHHSVEGEVYAQRGTKKETEDTEPNEETLLDSVAAVAGLLLCGSDSTFSQWKTPLLLLSASSSYYLPCNSA